MMHTKEFLVFKDRLIEYLRSFIKGLQRNVGVIEENLRLQNEELKKQVMEDIVLLQLVGVKVVLVHGGGPEISEMLKDHDHVIITNHGRGESVLINIEDYAKYEEFLHQRYVAEALAKAKQQAADPDTQWADHESVWETLSKQYDV